LTPFLESRPQKAWLNSQRFADGLEREGAIATVAAQPLFGFLKEPLARTTFGVCVILEAPESVLQHCHHQPLDGSYSAIVTPRIVVLLRGEDVRHENRSEYPVFPFHLGLISLSQVASQPQV
jgi:hypothetical protein